jgi:hypothetical protein
VSETKVRCTQCSDVYNYNNILPIFTLCLHLCVSWKIFVLAYELLHSHWQYILCRCLLCNVYTFTIFSCLKIIDYNGKPSIGEYEIYRERDWCYYKALNRTNFCFWLSTMNKIVNTILYIILVRAIGLNRELHIARTRAYIIFWNQSFSYSEN